MFSLKNKEEKQKLFNKNMDLKKIICSILAFLMIIVQPGVAFAATELKVNICFCENANNVGHSDPNCTWYKRIVEEAVELCAAVPDNSQSAGKGTAGYDAYMEAVSAAKKAAAYLKAMNQPTKTAVMKQISDEKIAVINQLAAVKQENAEDYTAFAKGQQGFESQEEIKMPQPNEKAESSVLSESEIFGNISVEWAYGEKRTVTIEIENATKVYGDKLIPNGINVLLTAPESTSTFDYDELISKIEALEIKCVDGTKQDETTPAGSYAVIGDVGQGTLNLSGDDYRVISNGEGILTVIPREITVKANDAQKEYGESLPELTFEVTEGEIVNGDKLYSGNGSALIDLIDKYGKISVSCDANENSLPGVYTANVNIPVESFKNYTYTVIPASLTIVPAVVPTPDDAPKVNPVSRYYGETNPAFTIKSGTENDAYNVEFSCMANETSPVGEYDIIGTIKNDDGVALKQYVAGKLTVNPRPVKVVFDDKTSIYGEPEEKVTYTMESIAGEAMVNGDSIESLIAPVLPNPAVVGDYKISADLSSMTNYKFNVEDGKYTLTKRPITVKIDNIDGVYGEEVPELTYTLESSLGTALIEGDSLDGKLELSEKPNKIGKYKIQSTLFNPNYDLTVENGVYTVSTRPIKVVIDNQKSVYGEKLKELTYHFECDYGETIIAGDKVFGGIKTYAAELSDAGTYKIVSTFNAPNYEFSFEEGVYTIGKRPVKIVIDNKSSVYGQPLEKLTYKITSDMGEPFVKGDKIDGTIVLEGNPTRNVGEYKIYSTMQNKNYEFSVKEGVYTITKRPLTVICHSYTRPLNGTPPTLMHTLSSPYGKPLVDGDTFIGRIHIAGDPVITKPGVYPITCTFKYAMSNYDITVVNGTFTVTASTNSSVSGETNGQTTSKNEKLVVKDGMYFLQGKQKSDTDDEVIYMGEVLIKAADGYKLSTTGKRLGGWSDSLKVDEIGLHKFKFFIMREDDNLISDAIFEEFEIVEAEPDKEPSVDVDNSDPDAILGEADPDSVPGANDASLGAFLAKNIWIPVALIVTVVGSAAIIIFFLRGKDDSDNQEDSESEE